MAARRGLQPRQGLGHHRHRAVEAEGALGVHQVVVDGLGHAHHRQAQLLEAVGDAHGAIATDGHQRVQAQLAHVVHHRTGDIGPASAEPGKRVGLVVRPEDGAALVQDAADGPPVQRHHATLDQAEKAPFDAGDARAAVVDEGLGDRADHGVEPGAVAAAGEHADVQRGGGHGLEMLKGWPRVSRRQAWLNGSPGCAALHPPGGPAAA